MITRLLLSDGSFVYPNFLSDEERQALSTKLGSENSKSDEVALCLTEAPTEQQIREFAEKLCF